ncbi:MAG: DUF4412 domain-containing protein [Bacteroidota bacterium]|nr:DUF4412 domain-containing protein [Bacteroidota bacterium]MDX5428283.1 DUF4412 domain-containing protein [Bacteroidota bacterium]MDX5506067.1 DUF4412 domain-containing protein [Bacteroidota bacterium]
MIRYIATSLLVTLSFSAQSQILKKLQNKLENKVDERIEEKADEKMDEALDAAFEGTGENNGNSTSDYDPPAQFHFDHQINMKYSVAKKGEKNPQTDNMIILLRKDGNHVGIEMEKEGTSVKMVMDLREEVMVSMTTASSGMKMGMIMSTSSVGEDSGLDENDFKITETGRKKEILGYTCKEYEVTTSDGHGTYWITEEIEGDLGTAYAQMANMNKGMPSNFLRGMVMLSEFTTKKGEVVNMEVTEVKENANVKIATSGYQWIRM